MEKEQKQELGWRARAAQNFQKWCGKLSKRRTPRKETGYEASLARPAYYAAAGACKYR